MINEANELFHKAEVIRLLLMDYNDAARKLVSTTDDKATAHQIVHHSSSLFQGQLKDLASTTKYALEFIEHDTTSKALTVAGFNLIEYNYQVKPAYSAVMTDNSLKAWAHVLNVCSELSPNAVQKRLSSSAFVDNNKSILDRCLGLVALETKLTVSITKR